MNIFFYFIKWNLEINEEDFILGSKGSGVCIEGTLITDETTCREACEALKIPQEEILGNNKCYKDGRDTCYQDGHHGPGASMICKTSEQISGRFSKVNKICLLSLLIYIIEKIYFD